MWGRAGTYTWTGDSTSGPTWTGDNNYGDTTPWSADTHGGARDNDNSDEWVDIDTGQWDG